jgi:hypothetical protein
MESAGVNVNVTVTVTATWTGFSSGGSYGSCAGSNWIDRLVSCSDCARGSYHAVMWTSFAA